ncbi:hypothetical protein OUZ56_003615 [Daphnia magna]|uniref:Uncharacterized protein n=1 Tax=Daphnia magna TaxID=35525 RepID=A0ABR0A984_9CRUS|nr:hypothetical protein OUZ56_003615 [Daphnia magna]
MDLSISTVVPVYIFTVERAVCYEDDPCSNPGKISPTPQGRKGKIGVRCEGISPPDAWESYVRDTSIQSRTERALSLSEKGARSRFSLSDEREPLNLKKRELELERRSAGRLARTRTPSISQQ